jgi:hypothetical protein
MSIASKTDTKDGGVGGLYWNPPIRIRRIGSAFHLGSSILNNLTRQSDASTVKDVNKEVDGYGIGKQRKGESRRKAGGRINYGQSNNQIVNPFGMDGRTNPSVSALFVLGLYDANENGRRHTAAQNRRGRNSFRWLAALLC